MVGVGKRPRSKMRCTAQPPPCEGVVPCMALWLQRLVDAYEEEERRTGPTQRTVSHGSRHRTDGTTGLTLRHTALQAFCGGRPPISIGDYLRRIDRYGQYSPGVPATAALFLSRVLERHNNNLRATGCTVHRLLISSFLVACKFVDDVHLTNREFAVIAGVPLSDMNKLEITFLQLIDYRLRYTAVEHAEAEQQLLECGQHNVPSPQRVNPKALAATTALLVVPDAEDSCYASEASDTEELAEYSVCDNSHPKGHSKRRRSSMASAGGMVLEAAINRSVADVIDEGIRDVRKSAMPALPVNKCGIVPCANVILQCV